MNKAPRFLIEYANYTIGEAEKLIKEYPHNTEIYNNAISKVDKAIFNYQYGYITVNEAMREINESFSN